MVKNKKTAICILAYNNQDIISETLSNIQNLVLHLIDCDVYLLDNGSVDQTFEVAQSFSFVKAYRVEQNQYFSGGANFLFDLCHSQNVIFMSSDVTPNSDAINKIIKYAEADQSAGIIGCKSKLWSGKFESNIKRFSDPMWLHCLHGVIGIIKPIYNQKEKWYFYNTEKSNFQNDRDIDVVQDSFIWINGDLIARGLRYDTQFKLYYTEDDICYRVRKMGYKVVCLQDAEVRHTSQATANQRKKKINSIYTDDGLRFCYKYYGVLHWILFKCDVVMMSFLRNLTKKFE